MKKKSIRKVLTIMRFVCNINDHCSDCPLNGTVCFNGTEFTDKQIDKAVNVIKEIIDSE